VPWTARYTSGRVEAFGDSGLGCTADLSMAAARRESGMKGKRGKRGGRKGVRWPTDVWGGARQRLSRGLSWSAG
jgi:hypothetical protein